MLGFGGVLAGCDDVVEIAAWARLHHDFGRTFLERPNDIPAHDPFTRVLALVHAPTLQSIRRGWLQQRRGLPGERIPIDGKTLRRTRRATHHLGAVPRVRAGAREAGLTLGQVAGDAQSHEIPAIPPRLELLDLHATIVIMDPAGCPKDIAEAMVEPGGD